VIQSGAEVIEDFPDNDGDHRVRLLQHLEAVEPDVALALRLPSAHGPIRVFSRVRGHVRLDLFEVLLCPIDLEMP